MHGLRRVALLVACLLLGSCLRSDVAFHCDDPDSCVLDGVLGTCEPDGWCSFPDPTCAGGARYGDLVGDGLAGQCVSGPAVDAPAGPPDGAPGPADAAAGADGPDGSNGCGNGTVDDGEDCDDGNGVDTDGCVACRFARCGDGKVRAGVEDCDDGNTMDGDSCSSSCIDCSIGDAAFVWPTSGHCYVRFNGPATSWANARSQCAGRGGHLATYSSMAENAAVQAAIVVNPGTYWIGLSDSAVEGTFVWDDDRPLGAFSNWNGGEPNGGINESCVEHLPTSGKWNDLPCTQSGARYLCELDGWTIDPATGHAYQYFGSSHANSAFSANFACDSLGGGAHLATVTSADEQAFVAALVPRDAWIGLNDIAHEGTFEWVTAEPLDYTHWAAGQPSAGASIVDCVTVAGADGTWDDRPCTSDFAYVCEID